MGIHYDYKSTKSAKLMEKQAKREKKLAEKKAKREAKEGFKKEEIKEKKTCFKVEEKVICVPAVRMPWHKCNPPTTSKTKTIKVLKKESYESPACSYKWSIAKAGESKPTATKTATDAQTTIASTASKPMPPIVRASNLKLRLRKGTDFTAPAK